MPTFAGYDLNQDQINNASTIVEVGRGLGATDTDLVVALMTAMQESSLVNNPGGDRDSAGLFQQRPSQGWGSYEQVTDPIYASEQFFKHLLAIPDRASMPLTAQAQAVQRSAFPDAYAKWENLARSLLSSGDLSSGVITGGPSAVTTKGLLDYLGDISNVFGQFGKAFADLPKVFALILKLGDPTTWVRVFAMISGISALVIGIVLLGREVRG